MGLETGTYVADLVSTWPLDTDLESQGAAHIRLIKKVLQDTFPAASGIFLPVGTVVPFAGTVVPAHWLFCDGSVRNVADFPLLSAALGTNFGASGGAGTFNLPDLRGRAIFGFDNDGTGRLTGAFAGGLNANAFAGVGGEQGHTLTAAETLAHTHGINFNSQGENVNHTHGTNFGTGAFWTSDAGGTTFQTGVGGSAIRADGSTGNQNTGHVHQIAGNTDSGAGLGSGGHNNVPPGIILFYIIYAGQ